METHCPSLFMSIFLASYTNVRISLVLLRHFSSFYVPILSQALLLAAQCCMCGGLLPEGKRLFDEIPLRLKKNPFQIALLIIQ